MTITDQKRKISSYIVQELKRTQLIEYIANGIVSAGQVASGRLLNTIQSQRITSKNVRILKYDVSKELGVISNISLEFYIQFPEGGYQNVLDRQEWGRRKRKEKLKPHTDTIVSWMKNKEARTGKVFLYKGKPAEKDYQYKSIAYLIQKGIMSKNDIQNHSGWLQGAKIKARIAIEKGKERFISEWEETLVINIEKKIFNG